MSARAGGSRRSAPLCACAACAVALGACLDDPPTFAPRGQVPPFIVAGAVVPPLSAIYEGPVPFEINVPFRSEDVNTDLEAQLYLDLVPGAADGRVEQGTVIPAGNFEDLRLLTMNWTTPIPGCHSLTLIMTYSGNYDVSQLPIDETRAARIVWWLNVGDVDGEVRMVDCPDARQVDGR